MSIRTRLLLLLGVTAAVAFSATITVTGPQINCGPQPPAATGICSVVPGGEDIFKIFSVQLTQPTTSNPNWVLKIETNYGAVIPGSPTVIPPFRWLVDNELYSIADFMIRWNNESYGVVLSPHVKQSVVADSFQTGSLYRSPNGFLRSVDVLVGTPRALYPVWIAPGSALLGTGTVSGAQTGNGTTTGRYTITSQFSAPANFLATGDFTFYASSYVCDNGFLIGNGNFTGGGGGDVPEPGTLLLGIPAALFFGIRFARQRRSQAA